MGNWTIKRLPKGVVISLGGVIAIGVAYLIVAGIFAGSVGVNSTGSGHFPSSLLWATPDPDLGSSATYIDKGGFSAGYTVLFGRDATYLNRTHNGSKGGTNLTYVNRDIVSKSYVTISVNPIDEYDWAATAMNSGHCYAIRVSENPTDPQTANTFYARFADGVPCRGNLATTKTVRSVNPPN